MGLKALVEAAIVLARFTAAPGPSQPRLGGLWFDAADPEIGLNLAQRGGRLYASVHLRDRQRRTTWQLSAGVLSREADLEPCGSALFTGQLHPLRAHPLDARYELGGLMALVCPPPGRELDIYIANEGSAIARRFTPQPSPRRLHLEDFP